MTSQVKVCIYRSSDDLFSKDEGDVSKRLQIEIERGDLTFMSWRALTTALSCLTCCMICDFSPPEESRFVPEPPG